MYVCVCVHICIYIYIYILILFSVLRAAPEGLVSLLRSLDISIYIYNFILRMHI